MRRGWGALRAAAVGLVLTGLLFYGPDIGILLPRMMGAGWIALAWTTTVVVFRPPRPLSVLASLLVMVAWSATGGFAFTLDAMLGPAVAASMLGSDRVSTGLWRGLGLAWALTQFWNRDAFWVYWLVPAFLVLTADAPAPPRSAGLSVRPPYDAPVAAAACAIATLPAVARPAFAQMARRIRLHALALDQADAALAALPEGPEVAALRERRQELEADQARLLASLQASTARVLLGHE